MAAERMYLYTDSDKLREKNLALSRGLYFAEKVIELLKEYEYEVVTENLRHFMKVQREVKNVPVEDDRKIYSYGVVDTPIRYVPTEVFCIEGSDERLFKKELTEGIEKPLSQSGKLLKAQILGKYEGLKESCYNEKTKFLKESRINPQFYEIRESLATITDDANSAILEDCKVYLEGKGLKIFKAAEKAAKELQYVADLLESPEMVLNLFATGEDGKVDVVTSLNYNYL